MRLPYALSAAAVICGIVRAQGPSPRDWIQAHYSDLRTVAVQKVVADAAESGFATTPAQRLALKKSFGELRGKERRALPAWKQPTQSLVRGQRPVLATDNVFEHESNDGWQYADDMLGQVATGSVLAANDVDSWRFVAPAAGYYTFEVQATGTSPIADSWLTLRNFKGDPIADDDNGNGLLSRINIFLPAGTYYLDVAGYGGFGGGEYNLVAQNDPVSVHALGASAAGTTHIAVGGVAHDVFQFTAAEGRTHLQVSSAGADTAMMVQRADGVVVFSNDDSSVGGFDAAADIDLPAGSYYAYVWDVTGVAGTTFTLAHSAVPGALPDLLSAVQVANDIVGDESMRLVHVNLSSPQRIDVMTDNGSVAPVGDTVMALLDRDLDYVLDVDDDDPFNPLRGFYSRIAMSLPAGNYYIAVHGFFGLSGDYVLTGVAGPSLPTGVANFGDTGTTILGFGEIATYSLHNITQSSIQVRASDFWCGILGPDGQLATNTRCASFQPQVGELPGGDSTLFVWDRYDYSGPLTMTVIPPLFIDPTNTVSSRGKEGDVSWLFVHFAGFVTPYNFGVGDRGFFGLPLDANLVTYGDHQLPGSGETVWGVIPPGLTGFQLQAGDLHLGLFAPAPALATWRNGVEF